MTYIDDFGKITTKGEPDPVVNLESYRLVLYHEMSDGEKRIELDPPLQLIYSLSPFIDPDYKTFELSKMIKEFENKLIFALGERK